jgi:hypothetical protein
MTDPGTTSADPAENTTAWMQAREAELRGDDPAPPKTEGAEPSPSEDDPEPEGAKPEGDEESESAETPENSETKETDPDEDTEKPAEKGKGNKKSVEQRISDLTRRRREAEAAAAVERERAEAAERRIREFEAGQNPEPKSPAEAPKSDAGSDPEPKEEDFDEYKDFTRALVQWENRQERRAEAEKVKAEKAEAETAKQKAALKELQTQWDGKLDRARETHPDFDSVIDPEMELTEAMGRYMMDPRNDLGAEMMYELSSHPEEAARIRALPVMEQIGEMHLIRKRLAGATENKQPSAPNPRQASKAPAPVRPVAGGAAVPASSLHDEKLAANTTAWMRKREAELRRDA